jgi:hypothetical protein
MSNDTTYGVWIEDLDGTNGRWLSDSNNGRDRWEGTYLDAYYAAQVRAQYYPHNKYMPLAILNE